MNRPLRTLPSTKPAPARFTAAEFLHMADVGAFDEMKVELDHGEIVRMNPPYNDHAFAVGAVMAKLFSAVRVPGIMVVPEITLQLPDETVRVFDAALVRRETATGRVLHPGDVLLAIEASDTTLDYDLGPKLRDYAAAGIAHYWVIDIQAKAVHVMAEPAGDRYASRSTTRFGEPLDLPEGLGSIVLD